MDLKANDILLFVLILAVPVYLFMSNKGQGNVLDNLKALLGIKLSNKFGPFILNICHYPYRKRCEN